MNQITGNISAPNDNLQAVISVGGVYVNDYVLQVEDIEGGHRLVITRGNEVQTIDFVTSPVAPAPEPLGYVMLTDEATGERRKLRLYNGELRLGEVIVE